MTIEDISLRQNRQNPCGKGRGFNIYGRGQSWISKIYTISKKYENKTSSPEKTKKSTIKETIVSYYSSASTWS